MADLVKSRPRAGDRRVYHRSFEQTQVEAHEFPTLNTIRRALPAHCFEPVLWRSFYYVARDFAMVVGLFLVMLWWGSQLPTPWRACAWLAYWFLQGTVFWGLFVLGHDCGHQSFSRSKLLNEIMGNILHGFILVPYQAWALSHRHHHQNTGHIFKDEPFVPEVSSRHAWKRKKSHWAPTLRRLSAGLLGTMWFPYLGGFSKYVQSHFWPWSPLFKNRRLLVAISVGSVACMLSLVAYAGVLYGFKAVLAYYGVPIFVYASWLVLTTLLHHNQLDVPWYTEKDWTFVKGNLSTVDRSYGVFNNLVHDIGTHQVHHLFIFIPHYHLREATAAFRKAFPQLARYSHRSIFAEYLQMALAYGFHGHMASGAEGFTYRQAIAERQQARQDAAALSSPESF